MMVSTKICTAGDDHPIDMGNTDVRVDDVDFVSFPLLPCPGPDLGHPTNAAGYRGPNSGLHRC